VFANVSKGQVAKKEDWEKAFNTTDLNKAIEEVGLYMAGADGRYYGKESSRSIISNGPITFMRYLARSLHSYQR
jgi:ribosome maturation protein Sdo1